MWTQTKMDLFHYNMGIGLSYNYGLMKLSDRKKKKIGKISHFTQNHATELHISKFVLCAHISQTIKMLLTIFTKLTTQILELS